MASVADSRPLRELIAEAKAEVTEEIEEHKEEEEEEETEAHLVSKLYSFFGLQFILYSITNIFMNVLGNDLLHFVLTI